MKKLLRYTLYRIAKRIIRLFVTLSLIVSISFGSIYYQYEKVEAEPVGALAVVGAIGSILGIANVTSGGSVTGMFAEQKDKITQWWSDFTNSGDIYVDSNNNYVFSGTATNALYDSLDSNSNIDAKVCSSFPSNSLNVPASFYVHINSWIASNGYNNKDILKFYCDIENDDKSNGMKRMYYYYIGDVAYIVLSLSNKKINFTFYNDNGQKISVPYSRASVDLYRGDFYDVSTEDGSSDNGFLQYTSSWTSSYPAIVYSHYQGYFQSLDNAYNFFPYQNFYCSRSLIVAKNTSSGISLLNKKDGLYITNNYYGSQIPPISKTVFEENNWDSVYNSYINNINTNNENWYVDGEVDVQALRDEMAKQSNIIKEAIVQGNIDIADKIDYTNEWLKKIYTLLGQIKTLIANNQGGGGGSGDAPDLSEIEDKLSSINTNFSLLMEYMVDVSSDLHNVLLGLDGIQDSVSSIDSDLDNLQQQYVVLNNIYSYMQSHPWGSGGGGGGPFITPTEDPWEPWFKYIDDENNDFPYNAILTKYNVIKSLIQGVAPYCFINFIGGVFNAFSTEAVTPEFVVPIKFSNSFVSIDEEVDVDLSYLDDVIVYLHASLIILFTVGLMWFSFPFIRNLIQIFEL